MKIAVLEIISLRFLPSFFIIPRTLLFEQLLIFHVYFFGYVPILNSFAYDIPNNIQQIQQVSEHCQQNSF